MKHVQMIYEHYVSATLFVETESLMSEKIVTKEFIKMVKESAEQTVKAPSNVVTEKLMTEKPV